MARDNRSSGRTSAPRSAAAPPAVRASIVERADEAVSHLRRMVVVGQVETVIAVGEYLIEKFYGGADNARSRSPVKAASLARLAERAEEFGMTPATLGYAVPVTLAAREIGPQISGRLGVSRLRQLLPVKDGQQRKLLAETAVSSSWTVEKLKARVRQIAKPHPGGRPELPALERLIGRLARVLEEGGTPAQLRDGLDRLEPAQLRRLLSAVNRIQADVERIEKLLQRAAVARPSRGDTA